MTWFLCGRLTPMRSLCGLGAFLSLFVFVLSLPSIAGAQGLSSYHIGNSLTQDVEPQGVAAIAALRGYTHTVGKHIRTTKSLDYIWNHPSEISLASIAPFGHFDNALANHAWDAVVIQPYPNADTTLQQDTDRVLDFIDSALPTSPGATFYLHSAWPSRGSYTDKWAASSSNAANTPASLTRKYHRHLLENVRDQTDASVMMIPVGEVLFALDEKLRDGELPGTDSVFPFYRDSYHLTYDLGRYIAGVTTYATLYGEDPAGLTRPWGHYDSAANFSPAFYGLVHKTVWEVITENSEQTGVPEPGTLSLLAFAWLALPKRTGGRSGR